MNLNDLVNKNIHLIGLSGTEGSSLALFLIGLGCKNITAHDFSSKSQFNKNYHYYHQNLSNKTINEQLKKIQSKLRKINYKRHYLNKIKEAEVIFTPSSWFRYHLNQPLKRLRPGQIFWNWYNLLLEFYQGKIIGVTGTAGKGTTTNLIYQILKLAKKKVWLVGESWQMLPLRQILKSNKNSFVVAELSNRTLTFAKHSKKSPQISIITNIYPNHLDDHNNSFSEYKKTKLEIAKYQKKGDLLIINNNDKELKKINWPKRAIFFDLNDKITLLVKDNPYFDHNHLLINAVASVKVAKLIKIKDLIIKKTIKKFKPREGRMETIKSLKGVEFINDAAATRPPATMAAIKSFPNGTVLLILEGSRKNPLPEEFHELINTIKEQNVKHVFISGAIASFLYPLLKKSYSSITKTKNLTQSVKQAFKQAQRSDKILLSPASESFGEFKDYRERINTFNYVVKKLR